MKRMLIISGPRLLALGVAAPIVATVLGQFGSAWWLLDLLAHFPVQYGVMLMVGLALALACRRWWIALTAGAGLVVNLALLAPLYLGGGPAASEPAAPIRLLHLNVLYRNDRYDLVADHIRKAQADVVFLQEMNGPWCRALASRLPQYAFAIESAEQTTSGNVMLVRRDLPGHVQVLSVRHLPLPGTPVHWPGVEAHLRVSGMDVAVLSIHPLPPMGGRNSAARDATLTAATAWAAGQDGPCIILGDLNATPWSSPIRRLRREADLLDARRGFGVQGTWPSTRPWLGMIPIDQCLHSPALSTLNFQAGPHVGSDHRSIVVTLAPAALP